MRLATLRRDGYRLGIVREGKVLDVVRADEALGAGAPRDMTALIEKGEEALEKLGALANEADEELWEPLSEVILGPPVPRPNKFLALAGNYREHIAESGWTRTPGEGEKLTPYVFMKPPSTTISGPEDPIVIPRIGRAIDWEVELGVVIGRRGKYIRSDEAYDYIFGYTVVNDVSERKFDAGPRSRPREKDQFFDWLNGKWFDGFAPTGPVVVTKDEIRAPHNLRLSLRVNGQVKQDSNTRFMIFSVPEIVAFVSRMMTLEPGDIIATGTPSGVGDASGEYLKPGDVVEAEVEGIGILRNPVVQEE
ncbi:MAG: FAA hydrolase family protein [Candidatus Latescibacterota bacterium]|nr:MAG: FAA hydrolase family protein [Candidatus Latescibacterota bacterium]